MTACHTQLRRLGPRQPMAEVGHEDAFPRPRLSARSRFSQGTFAGTRGNGRDAPIPAVAPMTIVPSRSAHSGHSPIIPSENNMFTVPQQIEVIAFQNQTVVYDILFRAASETLPKIAA